MPTITNLLPNPSAETDLVNIGTSVASVTRSRVLANAVAGSYAVEVVCAGSVGGEGVIYQNLSVSGVPAGVVLTGSISAEGSGQVQAIFRFGYTDTTAPFMTAQATTATLSGTPTRLVTTATTDPARTLNRVWLYIRTTATAQAVTFYTDAAMLHEGAAPVDYFDGDSPGAVWTGTPHASSSVLTLPDPPPLTTPILRVGSSHIGPLRAGRT